MTHVLHLGIGGVDFSIRGAAPIVHDDPLHNYDPFLGGPAVQASDIEVGVRLERGDHPDTGELEQIFDSGHSWTVSRSGNQRCVIATVPRHGEVLWSARFDLLPREITVYCGERMFVEREDGEVVSNPVRYPLDQILLMYVLGGEGGILVHAAGMFRGTRGLAFPGPSGAGKTTLSRLLEKNGRNRLLSDDRIVLRKGAGGFRMHGTPWPGEAGTATNGRSELRCLVFMRHGGDGRLAGLSPAEAAERLMPTVSVPWYDGETAPCILAAIDELVTAVPAFEFAFTPGETAVEPLEELLSSSS